MPPFGELYGVRTFVDPCFTEQPEFVFQGGSHDELVAMRFADYRSLARVVVAKSCLHAGPRLSAPRPTAPSAASAAA
jgi:prolyl-tRNA editing enzyme YbaK/EbsC (Cys-tRNA(Pro) deacylase)